MEAEAAWKPVDWFRWDANATWSRNRVKGITVQLTDGSVADLGDQPLAFSPDWIVNNIFSFSYRGFSASAQSQYVSKQYLTNTGFESYKTLDDDGKPVDVSTTTTDGQRLPSAGKTALWWLQDGTPATSTRRALLPLLRST